MDIENKELEELDNIVYLTDDEGNEEPFEYLDSIEYDNHEYAVFLPVEDDPEEVVILEVIETGVEDEVEYVGVEDEEILDAVFAIFKDRFEEDLDFE